jgi:hypothetical protein
MGTKMDGKGQVVTFAKQLIAGADKHLASATQVTLAGSSYTQAQITAKLQSLVDLRSDVDVAKAVTRAKLAAEQANTPALRTLVSAFVTYVKAAYGTSPDVLADFGITPKARVPLTVEAKVAAVAKREATRHLYSRRVLAPGRTGPGMTRQEMRGRPMGACRVPQVDEQGGERDGRSCAICGLAGVVVPAGTSAVPVAVPGEQ